MRVKCLAQEHNTMTRPGLKHGPFDPESSALTTRLYLARPLGELEPSWYARVFFSASPHCRVFTLHTAKLITFAFSFSACFSSVFAFQSAKNCRRYNGEKTLVADVRFPCNYEQVLEDDGSFLNLRSGQLAHPAGTCPGFSSMKRLGVLLLLLDWTLVYQGLLTLAT